MILPVTVHRIQQDRVYPDSVLMHFFFSPAGGDTVSLYCAEKGDSSYTQIHSFLIYKIFTLHIILRNGIREI